jgi:hypothetical protein
MARRLRANVVAELSKTGELGPAMRAVCDVSAQRCRSGDVELAVVQGGELAAGLAAVHASPPAR